tara:strand:- start:99 stop:650 length:552 start_codon:yes stop_codon:yes gene_type:complete
MSILELKEPVLLDDILTKKDNLQILDFLFTHKCFQVEINSSKEDARLSKALDPNIPHAGFSCVTAGENHQNFLNDPLNLYALVIVNQISRKLNFEWDKITRVNWNYYCKDQAATSHGDAFGDEYFSILYNPHTTDGGTVILDKPYKDTASQAKFFKSSWLHHSLPPIKDKGRVALNIVIKVRL